MQRGQMMLFVLLGVVVVARAADLSERKAGKQCVQQELLHLEAVKRECRM